MKLSASEIVLEYVCPMLGVLTANFMFAAPVQDCYKRVKDGQGLLDLNPTPWAFMLGNTFGWVAYGILIQNLFVFFGNAPGFLISVWLNLQAVKMQYESFRSQSLRVSITSALEEDTRRQSVDAAPDDKKGEGLLAADDDEHGKNTATSTVPSFAQIVENVKAQAMVAPSSHDLIVLGNVLVWLSLITLISFASVFSSRTKELIVGITVNCNLVIFYGAPLSTIWTVLKERSSSSIHVLTCLANTFNGIFWAAYGIAVLDPFIFVPNSLGACLGLIQIVLRIVFPSSSPRIQKDESSIRHADDDHAELTVRVDVNGEGTQRQVATLDDMEEGPVPAVHATSSGSKGITAE